MRVADAEPITEEVFQTRGVIGLSAPAAVPLEHEAMRAPLRGWLESAAEVALVAPCGPDDAREFVGECDGGFVVATTLLQLERPYS